MLLEAVAKRGGYATLSELMRDALIHISHAVLYRAAYPNRPQNWPPLSHSDPWDAGRKI